MADIIIASKNAVFGQVSRSFNPECEAIIQASWLVKPSIGDTMPERMLILARSPIHQSENVQVCLTRHVARDTDGKAQHSLCTPR